MARTEHILKIEPRYYLKMGNGKTCEIRKHDMDFQAGDVVNFNIIEPGSDGNLYSWSDETQYKITHVLTSDICEGLKEGYCALSLKQLIQTRCMDEKSI